MGVWDEQCSKTERRAAAMQVSLFISANVQCLLSPLRALTLHGTGEVTMDQLYVNTRSSQVTLAHRCHLTSAINGNSRVYPVASVALTAYIAGLYVGVAEIAIQASTPACVQRSAGALGNMPEHDPGRS